MRHALSRVEFGKGNGIKPRFLSFIGWQIEYGFGFGHSRLYHKGAIFEAWKAAKLNRDQRLSRWLATVIVAGAVGGIIAGVRAILTMTGWL
jgi:hypothetical protein